MQKQKDPGEPGMRAPTPKRKGVPPRLRFEVFKRDGFACVYCGACAPGVVLHADHVDPVALGGADDIENLVTSCAGCNGGKGAVPLSVPAQAHTKRTSLDRARAVAEVDAAYNEWLGEQRRAADARALIAIEEWNTEAWRSEWKLTEPGEQSMRYFCGLLLEEEIRSAMYTAIRKIPWAPLDPKWKSGSRKSNAALDQAGRRFRYFCGICHATIKRRPAP